jgi:predicted TIM-barrel fold metal-dependent hydrolase
MIKSNMLAGRKVKKKNDGIFVVDADVHAHELPGALVPYIEMPWRKGLENLAKVPARYLDIPGFAPNLGSFPPPLTPLGDRRLTVTSAKEMRQDLDDLGVDVGILFPDHFLSHAAIKGDDYAVALARAYNRWLVDEWLGEDNGLKGAILAPHHDPVAAAEQVRRYADHPNIVAIFLPTSCVEPLYGHRRYDPLYIAAEETGLPVMFHSVTAVHPVFPFNLQGYESVFAAHALAHPFSLIANLVSMMETGVPARFPKLQVAFTEGGISWVPWIMMRLDKEYMERRREVPWLTERPSEYIRKMYFATQPIEEPEHLKDMATLLTLFGGEDSVMFASDWPHHDFDHPTKVLQIPVSDEVRRKLMGLNAAKLLKLEVPVQ